MQDRREAESRRREEAGGKKAVYGAGPARLVLSAYLAILNLVRTTAIQGKASGYAANGNRSLVC